MIPITESKAKIYYGYDVDENRPIFTKVTGEMSNGTLVYTEIEQNEDGSIITVDGSPKLILDNQYIRRLKHGQQTFHRI